MWRNIYNAFYFVKQPFGTLPEIHAPHQFYTIEIDSSPAGDETCDKNSK
jgi:hypothetical protein